MERWANSAMKVWYIKHMQKKNRVKEYIKDNKLA